MDLGLTGQTALITGGSRGIGLGIAQALATEGVHLHLVGRDKGNLEGAKLQIEQQGRVRVWTHSVDIAEQGSAELLAQKAPEIDILVNNAGATPSGDLLQVDEAAWRKGWDIKVYGCINLTRAYYRLMVTRRSGTILNIIGISAERVDYGYIAGCSGNAAIAAFTKTLGGRSLDFGVRVVGISPGTTETDRAVNWYRNQAQAEFGDAEKWRDYLRHLPLGRPAKPSEIGAVAAFLCSKHAAYMSGAVIPVDAGYMHAAGLS